MEHWSGGYPTRPGQEPLRKLGAYEMEAVLGQGAVATVYRARWKNQRTVAIKVLHPAAAAQPHIREALFREYRLLARLHHPGIVQALDAGEMEGRIYLAMELIEGENLDSFLTRVKSMGEEAAIDITRQVADALHYVHEHQIVHRDIKPGNIILTRLSRAILFDFGAALDLQAVGDEDFQGIFGTPSFVAPEQIRGDRTIDGRADLYSLGVVLYRMVTGRRPFYGSRSEVLEAHLHKPPPPPSQFTYITPELEEIIRKALAKDPADRFQTGAELSAALAAVKLVPPPRSDLSQRLLGWLRDAVNP